MGSRTRYCKRKRLDTHCDHNYITFVCTGDNTPSPNTYFLPPLLGSKVPNKLASASYSMAGRPLIGSFAEDLSKTPGPGRYNPVSPNISSRKQPVYSMLGRTYMPGGMYGKQHFSVE